MKEAPLRFIFIILFTVLSVFAVSFSVSAEECVWSDWVIDEQPTCTSVGYRYRTCLVDVNAPHTETEIIPMLEHSYEVVYSEPNCTRIGICTYICKDCGYTYSEEYGEYAEHQYQCTKAKEPTCTEEGEYTYVCTACGDSYTDTVPKTEHKYIESVIKEPDCQEIGIKEYICIYCGDCYTENYGDLNEHTYFEFTEEKDGYIITFLECEVCGERYETGRERIAYLDSSEMEQTEENPSMAAENTAMAALNLAAAGTFTALLVPDFKVLRWHRRMKKLFFMNKIK